MGNPDNVQGRSLAGLSSSVPAYAGKLLREPIRRRAALQPIDFTGGASESVAVLARASRAKRVATRAAGERGGSSRVLSQELFRSALVRERKRADRFEQSFALVLLKPRHAGKAPSRGWVRTVAALSAAIRETEVLGWLERGAVLGVIVPEIGPVSACVASELEGRIEREFAGRASADILADCALQVHVHLHPASESGSNGSADLLMGRLQASGRRRAVGNVQ
jgi:hypothetical protein